MGAMLLIFYLGATESRSVGLPPLEQKRTGWQGVPSSTPPLWARGAVRVPSAQERVPRASVEHVHASGLPRAFALAEPGASATAEPWASLSLRVAPRRRPAGLA